MNRFSIFKKSDKSRWSYTDILYVIAVSCILIFVFERYILKIEHEILEMFLMSTLLIVWFLGGIVLKFFRLFKPDPLKGKLEGFLTFEMDKIIVGKESFSLDEIKTIWLTNDDYYGKSNHSGSFGSNLSNGVNNSCKITLINGREVVCNYELYNSNDLQKIKPELVHYYKSGKLDFEHLSYLLGIGNKEIEAFNRSID